MKTARFILIICGLAIILGALGFVMITDIFLSDIASGHILTTAMCCFGASSILRAIEQLREGYWPRSVFLVPAIWIFLILWSILS